MGVETKHIFMRSVGLICLLLCTGMCIAGQNKVSKLSDLAGMAGCWERNDKARSMFISEQWMKPAGTSILGMGRTVKNGATIDHEFMRIEERADGLYFVAKPSASNEETEFKLIRFKPGEVIFENPEHDFPQRVIYKFDPDKLTGRIEGNNKGKFLAVAFPMVRTKCGN